MVLTFSPGLDMCAESLVRGEAIAVCAELIADTETPISVLLKMQGHVPIFLLESAESSMERGRFSVIGLQPDATLTLYGDRVKISSPLPSDLADLSLETLPPLEAIRKFITTSEFPIDPRLPPMAAGVFGYLGYACVRLLETSVPDDNPDVLNVPDACLFRPSVTITHDRLQDTLLLTTVIRPEPEQSPADAYRVATQRLEALEALLDEPVLRRPIDSQNKALEEKALQGTFLKESFGLKTSFECNDTLNDPLTSLHRPDTSESSELKSSATKEAYCHAVERARDYILAGDAFQIVLAQRFSRPLDASALELYRAVRRINPSPYMFYLDFGDMQIVGASPETLVRLRKGEITIRPLAGSARRGATPEEDAAIEQALLSNDKERAEHLMLLDLGRNDVGRAAQIGTVEVQREFAIERYSHIMHISSTVTGYVSEAHDGLSALLCGFPAGTLSGAPKVRAMQIIDELETERRGIYAGGIGYFGANGDMETCIVLRTGVVKDKTLHVSAGAGVVADSVSEQEYEECRTKARAMFRAAEEAERIKNLTRVND